MLNQPKLHFPRSALQKTLDVLAIGAFVAAIIYGITQWSSLPVQVPIHYNALGEPDGWGSKCVFFIVPALAVALWIFCHVLELKPHLHNYSKLTVENTERLYKNSMLLCNVIKNEILLFFAYISWDIMHMAHGGKSILGIYEMLLFLLVLFGTLAFFVVRFYKLR